MPSTATTNVSISTILDLIGPTQSSIGSDDGQPAFDSVLNSSPSPSVYSGQPAQSSKRPEDQQTAARDSRQDDSRPTQSTSSNTPDNSTSDSSQSKRTDKAEQAASPPAHDDQDRSEHSEEKSEDVQQLIAQSLAAIPAATPITALPAATAATEEATTTTEELPAAQVKSKAAQAISRGAQKTAPQAQADDSQTVSPVAEVAAATTEALPLQPTSPTVAVAKHSATDESAKPTDDSKLATSEKTEATDKPEQTAEVTFESTLDNDKSSQSSHQDSSAEKQSHPDSPDPTVVAPTAPDPTTTTNPTATPIVAPVATAPTDSNQPAPAKTTDQNQTSGVTASGPRSRLPAQALAPANATNNRRPAVEVDSARLLTRVVRAFSAAQERDGEVHLRLSPPELGSLRLDIRIDNGALTARMQTETEAARTAIIDNLPALRERLAEQGVRIERFDVDLMQRQAGGTPDQSGGRQPEQTEPAPRFVQPARASSVAASSSAAVSAVTGSSSGLNVIV